MNKKKLAIIISIAALVLVGLGIGLGLWLSGGKQQKDASTEEHTQEASTDTTQEAKEQPVENKNTLYDIVISTTSQWEVQRDGKTLVGATYNIDITNHSDVAIESWSLELQADGEAVVTNAWGLEGTVKDQRLSLTGVDWGAAIAPGATMSVGFNLESAKALSDQYQNLMVNGEAVQAGAVANRTTEATTEAEPEKPAKEPANPPAVEQGTPLENHGALRVEGTQLVDEQGKPYQLKGVSTHGIAWFPQYVNKEAFKTLRDDWGANVIRIAMYTDENGGYCAGGNQEELKKLVQAGVDYATELGMYVIIDWHILHDLDPTRHQGEAEKFFEEMASRYGDYDNVIYEICNEPNGGTTWEGSIKPYAMDIIPIIRKYDKDAIVIVGTPTWSQDVDVVAKSPLEGQTNVMYAVHFYAATHTDFLRNKVKSALDSGLPIFVSEFSLCDASGNGANDFNQSEQWFQLINENNLSYCSWSLSNKAETSALIQSSCNKTSGWSPDELSETGQWIRNQIKEGKN